MNRESFEQHEAPETFPSLEEVKSALAIILEGKESKELRQRSDAQGVQLYEVEVAAANGEKLEYNFQRAQYNYQDPSLPSTARFSASIHMTIYDADGIPYDGQCVANFLNGTWQYVR